ncbi:efflux RND transporter periplasmic adaptor subunit [Rhizobium leguminosarum]|nr:efflux RND transporter periplasmic adaptor subunit [Rhizobium leguminosarum]
MMRAQCFPIVNIAVIFCISALLSSCNPDAAAQERPAARPKPEVRAQTLHRQAVPLTTELAGRTGAQTVSEVRPRVSGIILRQSFEEGGMVKAGDILYELDPTPFEASYRNAEAALRRAESALPSARARSQRYQSLSASSVVSRQDFDEARTQMLQAEADVAAASAALETARIELEYTKVRAPISGRADASNVTEGALVTEDQASPMTTIRQTETINVDLVRSSASLLALNKALASQDIRPLEGSVTVELRLEDGSKYGYPGKLQFRNGAVSQSTGMVLMRAVFPNPEGVLMPGMYVRALVEDGCVEDAVLIPQRAVSRNSRGDATARFIGAEGRVQERVLSVERGIGNNWLVTAGVENGDRVVVEGLQRAAIGEEVNVSSVNVDEETGEIIAEAEPPRAGQPAEVSARLTDSATR